MPIKSYIREEYEKVKTNLNFHSFFANKKEGMKAVAFVLLALVAGALAQNNTDYNCGCKSGCCTTIPSDGNYYLTSFCDSSTACGQSCGNCQGWYATSAIRFRCNAQLKCCRGNDCVTLKVIDSGPGCWVEEKVGRAIIDASYSTCKHFTGGSSCGWSDRISINCKKITTDAMMPDDMLGPCANTPEEAAANGKPLCPSDDDCFYP